ncbi:hypothetical protein COLO4_19779 [Corchorus olitorius]|uniref:Uncharacterized protein n=1 Tax=Corchorus olitorius TaxID=93759 RepID=A0A1R3J3H7_9ROSI|nr:hypothetical protein COLO4_19779 [Corchorus olitorius]
MEVRFGPAKFLNPQTTLFKLRQTSTVSRQQMEFELLSNRVSGLSDGHLLNLFVSGLRSDIQQDINIHNPRTLAQAIELAKLIEAMLLDQRTKNDPPDSLLTMEPSVESSPPITPALSTLPLPPPPTETFNTDLTDF